MDNQQSLGKTTIAPEVLVSICQLATLSVDGVSHMAPCPVDVNTILKKNSGDGVKIEVEDNMVLVDIYVVLKRDMNVIEISHKIQQQVAREITEMVGMNIGRINIHVEDIDFGE